MLSPVHKPQHWSLVVSCRTFQMLFVYPKLKFIPCIDSLHFSNVDEVNWIWLDIIILCTYMLCMGSLLTYISRMYLCSESYNQSSQQITSCEWKYHDSVNVYIQFNTTPKIDYCLC